MFDSEHESHSWSGRRASRSIDSSLKVISGRHRSKGLTAVVAGGLLIATAVAMPLPALADTVSVTSAVVAADGSKIVTAAPGVAKTVDYALVATNLPVGDPNNCDANGGSGNSVIVSIHPAAGLTVSAMTLTFTTCDTKTVNFTASSPGDYQVTTSALGGRDGSIFTTGDATFTLRVVSPNLAPTVTVTGVAPGASYEHGSVPLAMCNVTDDHDAARTFAAPLSTIAGSLASYGLGSQTAACSATDTGGLTSTASADYSIVDTTKPTLTVPGDITKEATGTSGAVVTYSATATDAVDGSPTVTCSAAGGLGSGSTFPFGNTLVTCTATDVAGNHDSKQFTITVQDKTPPTLTLPASITEEATGPSGATVTYSASATDSVDGAITPSCAPASATTFGIATTLVGCTATDAALNQSTGSFAVTVQDTTRPTLTLPTVPPLEATGPNGAALTYSATASDIVDVSDAVTCDYPTGTVFAIGTTTVSCSATDAHGNIATGNFPVTVQDTTKPVLTLPANISEEATKPAGRDIVYSASASDLVDGNVVTLCSPANGTFALGTTTVTCSGTDNHGNKATGSFTVTVEDNTAPVLSAGPGDQLLEATGPDGAVATFTPPTATDIVDGSTEVSCDATSGATFALGVHTVTCSTTDAAGNLNSAAFTIKVQDTTKPALQGTPTNMTPEATSPTGAVVAFTAPTATDAVSGSPEVTCNPPSGFPFALDEVTTITCTAIDSSGNEGTESFTITVHDTQGPVFGVLENITKEATSPDGATASWADITATDVVDGAHLATCDPASGSLFHLGDPTAVTCTAFDLRGHDGVGGFTVTVEDTTAPALTVPSGLTVEATGPGGAAATFIPTATDLVDVTVTPTCAPASGSTFPLGPTTVTCTATDTNGNTSPSQTFTVRVVDTTQPDVTAPDNMTLEATSSHGATGSFTGAATDLVDGTITPTCTPGSGSTFPLGPTTVTCTATDTNHNTGTASFDITVVDTTKPVLSAGPGDQLLEATGPDGAVATFTPPTATDIVDGSTEVSCDATSGATFALGVHTVTCSTTDAAGNLNSAAFTIKVQDTTKPALQGTPTNMTPEATSPTGAVVAFTAPTATDAVSGSPEVTCNPPSGFPFALDEVTTITCTAIDSSGNEGTESFTITVHDTQGPVFGVLENITKEATSPDGATASWADITATDVVDGAHLATCDPASGSLFHLGDPTAVTCTAADTKGNPGVGGFTVTVEDTTAPALTVPSGLTVEATGPGGAAATFTPTATDLVDVTVTPTCAPASGSTFPLGPTTVTCTATDANGNTSPSQTFTVRVVDTTQPDVTAPDNMTLEATSSHGATGSFTGAATDLVDGTITPTCTPGSGSTFPLGPTTVTCTATDTNHNTGTASFTITVVDTTKPVVSAPVNITALASSAAGAIVTFTAPTATDAVTDPVLAVCDPPSGSLFKPGTNLVTCSATDATGNKGTASFTITVRFDWNGFFAPVDNKILNGMKAGSTAPIKWSISNQSGGYVPDLTIVNKTTSGVAACATGALVDDLELYATGGTQLRYDSTAHQFIYNWQSPKKPGTCYTVTIGLTDGTAHSATFQLK